MGVLDEAFFSLGFGFGKIYLKSRVFGLRTKAYIFGGAKHLKSHTQKIGLPKQNSLVI